jgi:hypothetical protein
MLTGLPLITIARNIFCKINTSFQQQCLVVVDTVSVVFTIVELELHGSGSGKRILHPHGVV